MKSTTNNSFTVGLRDGTPIGLGYLSVSFAFGIFAVGSGFYDVIFQLKIVLQTEPDDFFVFYDEDFVLHVNPPF